ncbi:Mbeg1-like protein [Sphingomonas sp. Y38-1Y]|uniref:Mbeg1-like protein n=1 Tax=Sphingomonas sp. Y38-1Y TaxID=3078265 RepID=UPI0028E2C981|nr:Mbeg1-like protein [Sphingomonas sp. Y38-1Y]
MIEAAAARIAPATPQPSALSPQPMLAPVAASRIAANDGLSPDQVRANALLSEDVYRAEATPPAGYREASAADLDRLGLSPEMLEQPGSSFRARVYATGSGASTDYVVAFRGSQTGEDWKNNVQQALGLNSESYAKALEIGKQIARSDEQVSFTGHSLGGGLASAAAVASGREAVTFNAAGLSGDTITDARAIAAASGRGTASVDAFHVPGEILHVLQQGGDRAIGFGVGGIVGGLIADAPEAYGTQHALPSVRPEGVNWFEGLNAIDRHGIDWVVAGANAL